ncbi:hypothetical protein I4F81_001414 [Pyropia yezoensis]|uniref:Uncharacterized protein n=1 Tax=Pyropia yezoensis TaxID=2788 RepID=A0ACC3BLF9_PYRYE|nr:hypothetical protein I4F81_001414 [Neopyropia yezoensis]
MPVLMPAIRDREVPFTFRTTAAIFTSWWDCVVPYVDRVTDGGRGGVRDSFGEPPRVRASRRHATVESMGVCAAAASAVLADHLLSPAIAHAYYARAAELGTPLPGKAMCRDGAASHPDDAGCYGVAVARRLITDRLAKDGYNEAGTDRGRAQGVPNGLPGRRPFRDVAVGHTPVNTPWNVRRLLRWTPLDEDLDGDGTYVTQRVTAPQASVAHTYLLRRKDLDRRQVPAPYPHAEAYEPDFTCNSGAADPDGVCRLAKNAAREVAKTATSVRRRSLVPFFDDKTSSLAPLPPVVAATANLSYPAFVAMEYAANGAIYDSMTAVWGQKLRHDAVRPATLVPRVLGGGRGLHPFEPTIRTMPHSEYPSASACICRVFTDAVAAFAPRRFPVSRTFEAGHFVDGPGAVADQPSGFRPPPPRVPPSRLTVTWPSLRALADDCSASRLWGGLHFPPAVAAGEDLCDGLGDRAVQVVACRAKGIAGNVCLVEARRGVWACARFVSRCD